MRKLETKNMHDRDITIYLTESQWRGLLNRYKIENIRERYGSFEITVPCALCVTFAVERAKMGCGGCPLAFYNCLYLLGKHGSEALSAFTSGAKVEWVKDANRDVRKGIRNLRKVLLNMPRIRRRFKHE